MAREKRYVLDTNVLLADPQALYAFPGDVVVIPETVFGEIDKLKTSRADHDLRFRGREVSRELFNLSEQGALADGVPLKNGGTLIVARLDTSGDLPQEYNPKSSDDRILSVAYQLKTAGDDVTLVTNDLNMLLKAQSAEIAVKRYGEQSERPLFTRVTRSVWQRYRIPILTGAAVVLAFLAVFFVLRATGGVSTPGLASLPPEVERLLGSTQKEVLQNLQVLERNPNDLNALINLGNIYYDSGYQAMRQNNQSQGSADLQKAAGYYEKALKLDPHDPAVGTDLAAAYYYIGDVDRALERIRKTIIFNPGYAKAHYNYGVFLQYGTKNLPGAAVQFKKTLALATAADNVIEQAKTHLAAIEASLPASGPSGAPAGTTSSGAGTGP